MHLAQNGTIDFDPQPIEDAGRLKSAKPSLAEIGWIVLNVLWANAR